MYFSYHSSAYIVQKAKSRLPVRLVSMEVLKISKERKPFEENLKEKLRFPSSLKYL